MLAAPLVSNGWENPSARCALVVLARRSIKGAKPEL